MKLDSRIDGVQPIANPLSSNTSGFLYRCLTVFALCHPLPISAVPVSIFFFGLPKSPFFAPIEEPHNREGNRFGKRNWEPHDPIMGAAFSNCQIT
jgi:hypothetical protein